MEHHLKQKESSIGTHENGACTKKLRALRTKVNKVQTDCSKLRTKLQEVISSMDTEICRLTQLVTEHYQHQNQQLCNVKFVNGETILQLKDKKGHFKNEAIVCVMQLIGENKVPPVHCGAVIKTIAKQLLNTHVPHADLPSSCSAIRFADRGHVISKLHFPETLLGTDHYDLLGC